MQIGQFEDSEKPSPTTPPTQHLPKVKVKR